MEDKDNQITHSHQERRLPPDSLHHPPQRRLHGQQCVIKPDPASSDVMRCRLAIHTWPKLAISLLLLVILFVD